MGYLIPDVKPPEPEPEPEAEEAPPLPKPTKWTIEEQEDGTAYIFIGRNLVHRLPSVALAKRHVKTNVNAEVDTVTLIEKDGYRIDITYSMTGRRRKGWRR